MNQIGICVFILSIRLIIGFLAKPKNLATALKPASPLLAKIKTQKLKFFNNNF